MDLFLGVNLPGLRQDHQIHLANDLLVLDCERAPHAEDAGLATYENHAPVRRHHRDHVQYLRHQVRDGTRLDHEGYLCLVVVGLGIGWPVPVDLDRGDFLQRLMESVLNLCLDEGRVAWYESCNPPSGEQSKSASQQ